jgi:hypothetical protein
LTSESADAGSGCLDVDLTGRAPGFQATAGAAALDPAGGLLGVQG